MADPICLRTPQIPTSTSPLSDYSYLHPSARLPTELWKEIFGHATMVPRGFDSSLMYYILIIRGHGVLTSCYHMFSSPFDSSDISDGYHAFLKRLSQNHRTKQALCLVSRKWRAMAQELIFEYLFLQDGFDWSVLADGLEASRTADESQGGRGAGWYVKRLEICTQAWTEGHPGSAAARVIMCCPNLRVLMIGGSDEPGIPAEVVSAVFESCARTLRCLEWSTDLGPQMELMFRNLPRIPDLEFLCMYVMATHVLLPKAADYGVVLPRLHTLEVIGTDEDMAGILKSMAAWKLPSLRRVAITGGRQSGPGDPLPFFQAHGARILILELDYLTDLDLSEDACDQALGLCTSLTDLILHVHWAPSQSRAGHPKVLRIGLRGLHLLDCSPSSLCATLDSLKWSLSSILSAGTFPALQLVRLLDFEQERFSTRKWSPADIVLWAFWVRRFERLGVRLEDHNGQLIRTEFSEINVLLPGDESRWWRDS